MAKNFNKGIDSIILGSSNKPKTASGGKRGRPKTNFKKVEKTSEQGTKENETRATFIVAKDQLEKIKAVAFWERTSIKDVLGAALDKYLDSKKDLKEAVSTYNRKGKSA